LRVVLFPKMAGGAAPYLYVLYVSYMKDVQMMKRNMFTVLYENFTF